MKLQNNAITFCDFCVRNSSSKSSLYLSINEFENRVSAILGNFSSLNLIALTGGEPFLHPNIVELTNIASNYADCISITTNGSIISNSILFQLTKVNLLHLIVSLDGPPHIHNSIRHFPNAHNRAKKFIKQARDLGLSVGVNVTVNDTNVNYIYETLCDAFEWGVFDASVALVRPEGRGKDSYISQSTLTETARQVYLAKRDFGNQMKINFSDPLAIIFDTSLTLPGTLHTCGAGSGVLHVRCNGEILLCTSCTQSLGNINETKETLRKIWEQDYRVCSIYCVNNFVGECGQCYFRYSCGGCRCRAEKENGFLSEDPLCPKNFKVVKKETIDKVIKSAIERTQLKNALHPNDLKKWLHQWLSNETFTRTNSNFTNQIRWGHDYFLGDGEIIHGEMGSRHIDILRSFIRYGALPLNLKGLKILDIGPWTGGESLLLSALGAQVDVFEEHPVYRKTIAHLAAEFQLPVNIIGSSLYELSTATAKGYDIAYMCGILTHLSDPVVALRIIFNQLRDGGTCLLETQTNYSPLGSDEFWGASRPGWVWWNPSRLTLLEMLYSVGFSGTEIVDFCTNQRFQLLTKRICGKELKHRMGLSLPMID